MRSKKTRGLGPVINIYRHRPIERKDFLFIALPGVFAVLIPLLYGYDRYTYARETFGPASVWNWSKSWYVLSIAALILFATLIILRMQSARRFVAVHENGLFLSLSNRQMYSWDQIAGISTSLIEYDFLGKVVRSRYQATLYPNLGNPISLDNSLKNFPELLSLIKAKLYKYLLPSLRENYQAGQWVYFGPIAVHKRGLKINNKQFDWTNLQNISVQSGRIFIDFKEPKSFRIPINEVPNYELLIELINERVNSG